MCTMNEGKKKFTYDPETIFLYLVYLTFDILTQNSTGIIPILWKVCLWSMVVLGENWYHLWPGNYFPLSDSNLLNLSCVKYGEFMWNGQSVRAKNQLVYRKTTRFKYTTLHFLQDGGKLYIITINLIQLQSINSKNLKDNFFKNVILIKNIYNNNVKFHYP